MWAKQKWLDMASFGDTVMALTGYQVSESRLHQTKSTWEYTETADDDDPVSS